MDLLSSKRAIRRNIGLLRSSPCTMASLTAPGAWRFYRQFMRPGDLCFDIGARRRRVRTWTGLGARVVAVERSLISCSFCAAGTAHPRR